MINTIVDTPKSAQLILRPYKGQQERFLSSSADITIGGGAAGGGKSHLLLMNPLRHTHRRGFECATFRRQSTQITAGGGLWDMSVEMYTPFGAKSKETPRHTWTFPSGAKLTFDHLQYEKSVKAWDGSQLALIQFDELQHFSETQFFYMMSRNRTTCGIRPYMSASCNPDPDSFLVHFLGWWIDEEGFPIDERCGQLRYFVRRDGELIWFDNPRQCAEAYPSDYAKGKLSPKSVTFIKFMLEDNDALKDDPDYNASLDALFDYERKRLKLGNWFARPSAGELFKTHYWKFIEAEDVPPLKKFRRIVRYWDRAASLVSEKNSDPDYTVGCLIGLTMDGRVIIMDIRRGRMEPHDVEQLINSTAIMDGREVELWQEQDPGAAGKHEREYYTKQLMGFNLHWNVKRTSKLAYWRPFASQVKAGNVYLQRGSWNRAFIDELAGVTDGTQTGHDDQADASSGGFMTFAGQLSKDSELAKITKNMRI
jgi:predicted phage terminase large subunit-like protein